MKSKTRECITPRTNHAACVIGNKLFVYGGVDKNQKYLSDVWECDLVRSSWNQCKIKLDPSIKDDLGIADHAICAVYDKMSI